MNENKKCRSAKKLLLSVLAIVLVIAVSVGITLAVLSKLSGGVNNQFSPATVDIETEEDFHIGSTVKSNVYIDNKSTTGVYIRAAIAVTWQNKDGDTYRQSPVPGKDYTLTQTDDGWALADDGYYYWDSPVAAGSKTGMLIDKCEVIAEAPADGYTLHVEIVAQAIQATPADAVSGSWGVTVDSNDKISK